MKRLIAGLLLFGGALVCNGLSVTGAPTKVSNGSFIFGGAPPCWHSVNAQCPASDPFFKCAETNCSMVEGARKCTIAAKYEQKTATFQSVSSSPSTQGKVERDDTTLPTVPCSIKHICKTDAPCVFVEGVWNCQEDRTEDSNVEQPSFPKGAGCNLPPS
jgi:hypothetical protein